MAHSDAFLKKQGERNALILELRQSGHTYDEISLMVRCSGATVATVCKAARAGGIIRFGGGGRCEPPEKKTIRLETLRQKNELVMADRIKAIGLDYIGGYENSDGHVIVQCQRCGAEFEASCITIRKGGAVSCPACKEAATKERERLERIEREAERVERMMATVRKNIERSERRAAAEDAKIHHCPICGKPTIERCCSSACQNTYANRTHEQNRRARIRDALVDRDITLPELFRRERGVCYICGRLCDWSDMEAAEDGTLIAGDSYPSIEHVVPLARGGLHSWNNVRLACRRCNTIKGAGNIPRLKFCE